MNSSEDAVSKADISQMYDSLLSVAKADADVELDRLEDRSRFIMEMAVFARLAFGGLTRLLMSGDVDEAALRNSVTAGIRDALSDVQGTDWETINTKQRMLDTGAEVAEYVVSTALLLREKGVKGETCQ